MQTARVHIDDRFSPGFFKSLAAHPAVEEIENMYMDDGRFFVWLTRDYQYAPDGHAGKGEVQRVRSFGSRREAWAALRQVTGADNG